MNINTAKRLSELLLEQAKQQDFFLADIQKIGGQRDFEQARELIGRVMGSIYLDALRPIFQEHPSLQPEGLAQ